MAEGSFYNKVRLVFLKGMETLGAAASNLASNAKLKAMEINLENRRREILTNFSLRAFELWQKGEQLPGSLSEMLTELSDIEDRLSLLRAQKYAKVTGNEAPVAPPADEAAEAEPGIPVKCSVNGNGDENAECEISSEETEPMDKAAQEYFAESEDTGETAEDTVAEEPVIDAEFADMPEETGEPSKAETHKEEPYS